MRALSRSLSLRTPRLGLEKVDRRVTRRIRTAAATKEVRCLLLLLSIALLLTVSEDDESQVESEVWEVRETG